MSDRPNILLITTDEQRFDTYGSVGSVWPCPPNLEKLRGESVLLTNAYSNCPICMPCRYTWLTGLYAGQTERGPGNGYDWPDYHKTMPQALRAADYHTALIGKLHAFTVGTLRKYHLEEFRDYTPTWGYQTMFECSGRGIWSHGPDKKHPDHPWGIKGCRYTDYLRERGLYEKALAENRAREESENQNDGLEPYRPGVLEADDTMDGFVVREMCKFIRDFDQPRPFFLHASFFAPHYPLDVPREFFELFRPEDMPAPVGVTDPGLVRRWQENRAMYLALTFLVDGFIGRLLEEVDRKGIRDNTLILFTTDHGDMLGDHGLHHKFHPHEGSCRTPVMVRLPGCIPPGVVLPGLVESVDVTNTILEAAGLSEDQRLSALPCSPGRSFWDMIRGGRREDFREDAYSEVRGSGRMLRRGDWKYTRMPGKGDTLFDLRNDPCELRNLAGDRGHAAKLKELQTALIDRMATIRIPPLQGKFRGDAILGGAREGFYGGN